MRADLVEDYNLQVQDFATKTDLPVEVFREIYKHSMDNRIFNNLK